MRSGDRKTEDSQCAWELAQRTVQIMGDSQGWPDLPIR